ncbi:hypothetical protein RhiirA4_538937 [Rhizophagus irregularis]|uniref:Uncharacterized protein n=1 Tax=Rhizophagus irregularis TaxID=588596 RepID=A0A2I1G1R6_9GLOM|nr:hypothetical protein RhiirA4_538937 [Rhizophagus irregularis]
MSSENFENTEFEPSINDIFQLLNHIKQILTYLKNCDAISSGSGVLDIDKHINIIIEQEKKFHVCLQKSIVQSNNLRNHAKDALDNLEILNDPNFDQNHVSDILQIHINNVEENRKETQEIIHKLWELYELYKITEIFNKRELQSLKHIKEDLEKDLKSLKQYTIILFIVVGFNLLIFQSISGSEFLVSAVMAISALIKKTNIRQAENEVNKLQKIGNDEYSGLIGHNSTDNHYNRILIKPTKSRWEQV